MWCQGLNLDWPHARQVPTHSSLTLVPVAFIFKIFFPLSIWWCQESSPEPHPCMAGFLSLSPEVCVLIGSAEQNLFLPLGQHLCVEGDDTLTPGIILVSVRKKPGQLVGPGGAGSHSLVLVFCKHHKEF